MTDKADRFNEGKLKYELIPPEWLEELATVFTKGAKKYAPNNWKKSICTDDHQVFINDRMGSALRHINAYRMGAFADDDPIVGVEDLVTTHLGHAAWNLLAILTYELG